MLYYDIFNAYTIKNLKYVKIDSHFYYWTSFAKSLFY